MKIYTKTGDNGETSLFGGDRVKKFNQRICAYGTIEGLIFNNFKKILTQIGDVMEERIEQMDTDFFILLLFETIISKNLCPSAQSAPSVLPLYRYIPMSELRQLENLPSVRNSPLQCPLKSLFGFPTGQ